MDKVSLVSILKQQAILEASFVQCCALDRPVTRAYVIFFSVTDWMLRILCYVLIGSDHLLISYLTDRQPDR